MFESASAAGVQMLRGSRVRDTLAKASLALCGAAALILLEGCGGRSEAANPWPEQCNLALKPYEKTVLETNGGGFSEPRDVALGRYIAQRCVRIAAVWEAQSAGTPDEVSRRAIAICQAQISRSLQQDTAWQAEPVTNDPRLQESLARAQREVTEKVGSPAFIAMKIFRDIGRDTAGYALPGQCWRFLDRHDVASLIGPQAQGQ